ncbi:MAG: hypothetical protein ACFFDP_03000 [Promethearchaeota archaeon]
MTSNSDQPEEENQDEPTDPIATLLFLAFSLCFGYLFIGSTVGIYPWMILLDQIYFIPTWEAAITFLCIITVMFVTLIGGLVRMKYSIIVVGIVLIIAVFLITFYAMLLFGGLIATSIST